MKLLKNGLSLVLSMILMFTLILCTFTIFAKITLFKEYTYFSTMEKEEYYEQIHEGITSDIEYALVVNNISPDYAKDIITLTEVKDYCRTVLNQVMLYFGEGKNYLAPLDLTVYEERLDEVVHSFVKDNGLLLDEESKTVLEGVKANMLQVIRNNLELVNLEFLGTSSAVAKIAKLTTLFNTKLFGILMVLPLIPIALIALIWGKKYKDALRWISYGFITCGFLIFMVFLTGYLSGFYNNIIIGIPYLKTMVISITKKLLMNLTILGFITTALGAGMLVPKIKQYIKRSRYKIS